jgi:hypothetical protein
MVFQRIMIEGISFQRTQQSRFFPPFYPTTETDPVSETLCYFEHWTMDKVKKNSQIQREKTILFEPQLCV